MKDKKSFAKNLKKVNNILWLAGTIAAFVVIIVALIVMMRKNYKTSQKEDILKNLAEYNAIKYDYRPGDIGAELSILDTTAIVPEKLPEYLDTIQSEDVKILGSYDNVSVKITEPEDEIESVIENITPYADFWIIKKSGVIYYGTPEDGTVPSESIAYYEVSTDTTDDFISALDNAILETTSLTMFIDSNYAEIPLTGKLCESLRPIITDADKADKIILELRLISELGNYTNNLSYLYDIIEE